ncbi:MAG: putative arginyl-tRNA--protein transferase [Pirellulaceae bacterium]|nr:MAG: putative arginyl-tRNA--protein transferase [Pirellulaceae bacterium]
MPYPPSLLPVHREHEPCPYLPAETACMPLYIAGRGLSPSDVDRLWAQGYRRAGFFFYQTQCPSCRACVPIRLPVDAFRPSRSQRRAWRRAKGSVEVVIHDPLVDQRRIELINKHRHQRQLDGGRPPLSTHDYVDFLVQSSCDTREFAYYMEQRLVGVAILDVGDDSCSAVYTYYDPDYSYLSLGTFSILNQIEFCQQHGARWLYLGFYIAGHPHMAYKARYRPHELRLDGRWRRVEESVDPT